jgi:putative phage-type endonuclease
MHPNVQKWLDFEYAPQKSQEWLDLRMGMLTASDAASAIGVNKYETPHQLLLKKCGKGEPFFGNEATRHGEKYEDEARILYEQTTRGSCSRIRLVSTPKIPIFGWITRWCF